MSENTDYPLHLGGYVNEDGIKQFKTPNLELNGQLKNLFNYEKQWCAEAKSSPLSEETSQKLAMLMGNNRRTWEQATEDLVLRIAILEKQVEIQGLLIAQLNQMQLNLR